MKGGEIGGWVIALIGIPFVVVVATSFLKFAVVLEALRRGFGAASIPPAPVAAALALLLTLFVMAPVAEKVWVAVAPVLQRGDSAALITAATVASEPVKDFLFVHTAQAERAAFAEVARKLRPAGETSAVGERDLTVLMAAFAAAELKSAFLIGFLVLLPFLVIDLLVSTALASLGVGALSPELVSLPFKLVLFALADGWGLLFRGLVLSYT